MRKSFTITAVLIAAALGTLLVLAFNQFQLYGRHEAIISQTEKIFFQYSNIREQIVEDIVEGNAAELGQVWTILIDNAIDAMDGSGTLEVTAAERAGEVIVEIADAGPGIPPELFQRIFQPFYTTKPPGKRTGLGLAIAQRIISGDHSGSIRCQSLPGRPVFTVTLPVEGAE